MTALKIGIEEHGTWCIEFALVGRGGRMGIGGPVENPDD